MRRILVPGLLVASLILPVAAVASQTKADASLQTTNLRVSTGVKAPALVQSVDVAVPQNTVYATIPVGSQVELSLTVDRNGLPQNIQVVKSLNPDRDANVVAAVRQFRFRPGTMDHMPIPVNVNLTVTIGK